jgi:hypothetical protein
MPISKDLSASKASWRRIEWEIVIFVFMVFFVPLFIVNSGMLGVKHPVDTDKSSKRHDNVILPDIDPSIDITFEGNRALLWHELISQCRAVRNSSLPSSICSLGNEDIFDKFLEVARNLYGQTHESITKESWRAHCQLQSVIKEPRSPLLCEAAAFAALPFHLRAENRRKIEEVIETRAVSKVFSYNRPNPIVTKTDDIWLL